MKRMFAHQNKLPKLPVPPLADTLDRYIASIAPLATQKQLEATQALARKFADSQVPNP